MLIKCPDCKRSISSDCERCIHCGCIIDSSQMIFEPASKVSGLGVASFAMIFGYTFYLVIVMLLFTALLSSHMEYSDSEVLVSMCIMFLFLFVYPIVQLIFGIIPLRSKGVYYKWPSIVGIVGGSLGMIIDVAIASIFIWGIFLT